MGKLSLKQQKESQHKGVTHISEPSKKTFANQQHFKLQQTTYSKNYVKRFLRLFKQIP